MLHDQYNIDSDSDEEENTPTNKETYPLVQDIQAVRENIIQTDTYYLN